MFRNITGKRYRALIGTRIAISLVFITWDAIKLNEEDTDEHDFWGLR